MTQDIQDQSFRGRGAQVNLGNPYLKNSLGTDHIEGLDEPLLSDSATEFFYENPKKIINKVDSPDIKGYSMNPYQGCEHGCIYCYARTTHEYWGYSAGLDFERKIIIKPTAPELLRKQLEHPKWKVETIMFSGNTDCYQPAERKQQITRKMLQVLLEYRHPVSMITKNSLILRDLDILKELAKMNLVHVNLSITTMQEELRQKLEPRTATIKQRFKAMEVLSQNGVPVNIMTAPIIPGLNDHEIPALMKEAAARGALSAGMTIVRLNGNIQHVFTDWIHKAFPDRAEKVLNLIKDCHGGKLNDSRPGVRMSGEGNVAKAIHDLFHVSYQKYFKDKDYPELDYTIFKRKGDEQLKLF